jgi:hypothetical protein
VEKARRISGYLSLALRIDTASLTNSKERDEEGIKWREAIHPKVSDSPRRSLSFITWTEPGEETEDKRESKGDLKRRRMRKERWNRLSSYLSP